MQVHATYVCERRVLAVRNAGRGQATVCTKKAAQSVITKRLHSTTSCNFVRIRFMSEAHWSSKTQYFRQGDPSDKTCFLGTFRDKNSMTGTNDSSQSPRLSVPEQDLPQKRQAHHCRRAFSSTCSRDLDFGGHFSPP
jgi:hypothetical protein